MDNETKNHMDDTIELGGGWCRANAHAWKPQTPFETTKGVVFVTFKCDNCRGQRYDDISLASGELLARIYKMPKGYILTGVGDARPGKSDWRKLHYGGLLKRRVR